MFIVNVPQIPVLVDKAYLGLDEPGFEAANLVAVTSVPNRPLFFTAHLESGALWQRLPIDALRCLRYEITNPDGLLYNLAELQPYSCLHGDINCISLDYLRHYEVKVRIGNDVVGGHYLFTVDVVGHGLAEDPEQHKAHQVCVLENGQLCAVPNNHLIFTDNYHTIQDGQFPKYKRVNKFYLAGG